MILRAFYQCLDNACEEIRPEWEDELPATRMRRTIPSASNSHFYCLFQRPASPLPLNQEMIVFDEVKIGDDSFAEVYNRWGGQLPRETLLPFE